MKKDFGSSNRFRLGGILERTSKDHLTTVELDALVTPELYLSSEMGGNQVGSMYEHLEGCAACQALLDRHAEAQRSLDNLKVKSPGQSTVNCPTDDELARCASGAASLDESEHFLQHVSSCVRCGPLLRHAMEIFNDEETPEETMLVNQMISSKRSWQRQLARRMEGGSKRDTQESGPSRSSHLRWFHFLIFATGAVILCFTALHFMQLRATPDLVSVSKLLDQAYTERRIMDLRLTDSAYAPMTIKRGAEGSSALDRPTSLLDAEAVISQHIKNKPEDPGWQTAKARADLVEGNLSEAAVHTFEQVLATTPSDAVRLDLASAYFQLAQSKNQPAAYGKAADLLGEVISRDGNNQVARFNRAIVLERLYLYQQAELDWTQYLKLDQTSPWADEARLRLATLQEKIQRQEDHSSRPLLAPGELWANFERAWPEQYVVSNDDLERYRDAALRVWLTEAFPRASSKPEGSSRTARNGLMALAQLFEKNQKDTWLRDVLASGVHDPRFSQTLAWLSESYRDDAAGKYSEVEAIARSNPIVPNLAVRLEAEWQHLFANRLSLETPGCLAHSEQLWREVDRTSYEWLKVRILLDYTQCADHSNNVELATKLNGMCLRLAAQYGFPDLLLRAIKVSADLSAETKGAETAMSRAIQGLETFRSGDATYMAGYNLLTTMDEAAESEGFWHLDAVIIAEALQLLGNDPDVGMRAVEQQRLANALRLCGQLRRAKDNLNEAKELLATLPDNESTRTKLAEIAVDVAKIDLRQGDATEALANLRKVGEEVRRASDDYLSFEFMVAYGKALSLRGENLEAEKALSSAMLVARKGLQNLPEERDRLRWARHCAAAYREMVRVQLARDPALAFRSWEFFKGASLPRDRIAEDHLNLKQSSHDHDHDVHYRVISGRLLRSGTVLVSYAVFEDGISAWVFDGHNFAQHWIPSSNSNIERLSRRFAAGCANPKANLASVQEDGRQIYRILLAPLNAALGSHQRLLIEPDGVLEQIPFAALVDEHGHYLGDSFSLSVSPGMEYVLPGSSEVRLSRASRALVVADASSHPELGLERLPGVDSEARWIASSFSDSRLLLGQAASSSAVVGALPTAEVFHFSGHAVVNPSFVGLVLQGQTRDSQNSILTANDLDKTTFGHLHLVVLSACGSAEGTEGSFSDAESLARSFLAKGVDQVVASGWSVDSDATSLLMKTLYRHLIDGTAPADALRSAEMELRGDKRFQHPFYWAAFSVFGNG